MAGARPTKRASTLRRSRGSAAVGSRRGLGSARSTAEFAAIQRVRMLRAVTELVAESGSAALTVADIVMQAGISRRTFYEHFKDLDGCVLAAIDDALARVRSRALPAYREQSQWHDAIRAGLVAILDFVDEDPAAGSLLVVGMLTAGPAGMRRREEALAPLIDAVDEGRRLAPASRSLSRMNAEGAVGAVLMILHARLLQSRRAPVADMLGELMGIVVMPYLGAAAASREAARKALPSARRSISVKDGGLPLRALDFRMTARTAKVIKAIAASPGSSNRQIADLAGIVDQGQASKLLARLAKAGVVENDAEGARNGEANSWRLTEEGAKLERMLRSEWGVAG